MKKIKGLLYCTKTKPYLADFKGEYQTYSNVKELDELFDKDFNPNDIMNIINGKIVAECDFEVEKITPSTWNAETERIILKGSCLKEHQLFDYIIKGDENESQNPFYAIHIKNLHIFDKPRELYDCLIHPKIEPRYYGCEHLSKAPQNMMYVELDDIKYILISIQPKELCRILNGEQTILIKKKVLKEMLENASK